jgi:hypothetical protein
MSDGSMFIAHPNPISGIHLGAAPESLTSGMCTDRRGGS